MLSGAATAACPRTTRLPRRSHRRCPGLPDWRREGRSPGTRPPVSGARPARRPDRMLVPARHGRPFRPITGRTYRRAFSRTVPVTQRHTVDRHHLEADLRSSTGWLAAGGSRIAGQGSSRGSIQRQRRHIKLEQARDIRHVSKFGWACQCLSCWPCRPVAGRACLARAARIHGRVIHRSEVTVPACQRPGFMATDKTRSVTKMPHRQSAFFDGNCYFVAVAAWMMTAYRRCQCSACNPAAVSR